MTRMRISIGIHGNRLYAHTARRRRNTTSDFAAISNENFFEHRSCSGTSNLS
jgi:hypothetical protein